MSQNEDDEIKDPVDSIRGDLDEAKSDLTGVDMIEEEKYEDLLDETYSLSTPSYSQTQVTVDPTQVQSISTNSQIGDDQTKVADDQKVDNDTQTPPSSTSGSGSANTPNIANDNVNGNSPKV